MSGCGSRSAGFSTNRASCRREVRDCYHQLLFDIVLRHYLAVMDGFIEINLLANKALSPLGLSYGLSGIALYTREGSHCTDQYSRAVGVRLRSSPVFDSRLSQPKKSVGSC